MLILRHNPLPADDLFLIERKMIKVADPSWPTENILETIGLNMPRVEMYGLILGIVERMGIRTTLGISASDFLDFLIDIDRGYHPNPYHSFFHAVDVTMVIYHLLQHFDVSQSLTPFDTTALMIAALCHDIGHPGKNNAFEVNRGSKLAQKYRNMSVLESHSCHMTMKLLTKHKLLRNVHRQSITAGSPLTETDFRRSITKAILATDMACHHHLQSNLTALVEAKHAPDVHSSTVFSVFTAGDGPLCHFEKESYFCSTSDTTVYQSDHDNQSTQLTQAQRELLCQALLHAADISNAIRPWPVCKKWSDLVCDEFFEQGKAERLAGLPVSPNMDPDSSNQSSISIQFSDFIVRPYFEAFAAIFPKASMLLDTLQENRERWAEEKMKAEPARRERPLTIVTTGPLLSKGDLSPEINSPSCSSVISSSQVSVAAGTVLIPSSRDSPFDRPFFPMRSASHARLDTALAFNKGANTLTTPIFDNRRRKSDQASFIYVRRQQNLTPSPPFDEDEYLTFCN